MQKLNLHLHKNVNTCQGCKDVLSPTFFDEDKESKKGSVLCASKEISSVKVPTLLHVTK